MQIPVNSLRGFKTSVKKPKEATKTSLSRAKELLRLLFGAQYSSTSRTDVPPPKTLISRVADLKRALGNSRDREEQIWETVTAVRWGWHTSN